MGWYLYSVLTSFILLSEWINNIFLNLNATDVVLENVFSVIRVSYSLRSKKIQRFLYLTRNLPVLILGEHPHHSISAQRDCKHACHKLHS